MPSQGAALSSSRTAFISAIVIALAALAAYRNSITAPFVLDDVPAIAGNATIRGLAGSLFPPLNSTTSGRPFLNFTLGLNYAAGGLEVRGYHAVNLLIHVLAGLTLFGVLRRTLALAETDGSASRPYLRILQNRGGDGPAADTQRMPAARRPLGVDLPAFAVALLWTVHPLQTESVTYVVQRAESLMGFFYLLTLYGFIRGATDASAADPCRQSESAPATEGSPRFWFSAAVVACLLGGATKEVIVSAPLIVLLYDRAFIAGSFRAALRSRWKAYAGLGCVWPELLLLARTTHSRYGTSGFDIGVKARDYYLTQFHAVAAYLRLSAWPHPLVFDYGTEWVKAATVVAAPAAIVMALLAATAVALKKWPAMGCAGAFFFSVLAPTSLVPGNRQTMAEHRMYLALIPLIGLGVALAWRLWGRRAFYPMAAIAVVFGWLTFERNKAYATEIALWSDTVANRPANPYARDNLADALLGAGRAPEAIAEYGVALRLKPDYAMAENDFGYALATAGRLSEAIPHYIAAARMAPDNDRIMVNLGDAFAKTGRRAEAIACFEAAVRRKPDSADAWLDLGITLCGAGRNGEAMAAFERALRLSPDSPEAYFNVGVCLAASGRAAEATVAYEDAVRLKPSYMEAHYNLAVSLARAGKWEEAKAHFDEAERLKGASGDHR